jgi:methylmalonyl-CoA mutase
MQTADGSGDLPERLLAGDFPAVDLAAWRREVDRLLKGAPFDKGMVTTLAEGLRVQPLYTAADAGAGLWGASMPGQAPFLRGTRTVSSWPVPWLVAQELPLADAGQFNRALLHDLASGQSAVVVKLDVAGRRGLDAATASAPEVGRDGTAIAGLDDLRGALAGVDLSACPLMLQAGAATLPVAAMVMSLAAERGTTAARLSGSWGCDPLALATDPEASALAVDVMYDHAALLSKWAAAHAPGVRTLAVTDAPWHEAGADGVLSLGLALSGAIDTLRQMETRGLSPEDCAPRLAFQLSLDTDFFLEIARLRALRVLWSDALAGAGVARPLTAAWVHARTGDRLLSNLDAQTNLLRTTTAAMAAACGGADSLHVTPWDALSAHPGEAGRRLARNLHLVLGHECRFGSVADPAGGAWYVEQLTREVGEGAWAVMQQVEQAGGLPAALRSGLVLRLVDAAHERRAARLARAQDVRVGVNRFATKPDLQPARPEIDPVWLDERRRAAASVPVAMHPADPRGDAGAQLAALGLAALRGATLGTLTAALGGDTTGGLCAPWPSLPGRRDAAPFEDLVGRVARLAAHAPVAGRVHCCCLGEAGRTAPRLDFVRGSLVVGGFVVDAGSFHTEAASAVAEAREAGAAVVMLVGLDETYPGLGVEVARQLASGTRPPLLMAAGRPGESTAALQAVGVTRFLHMGSDLVATLHEVADALGGDR